MSNVDCVWYLGSWYRQLRAHSESFVLRPPGYSLLVSVIDDRRPLHHRSLLSQQPCSPTLCPQQPGSLTGNALWHLYTYYLGCLTTLFLFFCVASIWGYILIGTPSFLPTFRLVDPTPSLSVGYRRAWYKPPNHCTPHPPFCRYPYLRQTAHLLTFVVNRCLSLRCAETRCLGYCTRSSKRWKWYFESEWVYRRI